MLKDSGYEHLLAIKISRAAFPGDYFGACCCELLDRFVFYYIKDYSYPTKNLDDNWIVELMADISDMMVVGCDI